MRKNLSARAGKFITTEELTLANHLSFSAAECKSANNTFGLLSSISFKPNNSTSFCNCSFNFNSDVEIWGGYSVTFL